MVKRLGAAGKKILWSNFPPVAVLGNLISLLIGNLTPTNKKHFYGLNFSNRWGLRREAFPLQIWTFHTKLRKKLCFKHKPQLGGSNRIFFLCKSWQFICNLEKIFFRVRMPSVPELDSEESHFLCRLGISHQTSNYLGKVISFANLDISYPNQVQRAIMHS